MINSSSFHPCSLCDDEDRINPSFNCKKGQEKEISYSIDIVKVEAGIPIEK